MEENKEFKFMWGQKQSAMIAEAMLPQMKYCINLKQEIEKTDAECINVIQNGIYENYIPLDAIERWKQKGEVLLHKEYSVKLFHKIDSFIASFFIFCDELNKTDFNLLSNKELNNILFEYQQYIKQALIYFSVSTPQATFILEQEIKKTLKSKLQDDAKTEECFILLSTPAELDETMKERIEFSNFIKQQKIDDQQYQMLEKHSRRFPALFFNTYSKEEVLEFLRSKLNEHKHKTIEEIDNEIIKIKSGLDNVKQQHEEIYAGFQDENLPHYAAMLQQNGLYRYKLKHVWSGAEYLCLNFISELNKRIGIPFDDFIKTHMFSDIHDFLEGKAGLSKNEVEARKKCLVIHHKHQITNIYSGDEAIAYKNKFIAPPEKNKQSSNNIIKGMIANKGKITGKVRIVHVKDLQQFTIDCQQFQKGEILVTTMTSPIMVPILEKAAGIITDEGGICSHAAVISREFNIPCIVGTQGASFTLKTGDTIELDAEIGVIRKICK